MTEDMKHIAVEGMDGFGKATVCSLLAQRLGYEYAEKSLRFLLDGGEGCENYHRIVDTVNKVNNKLVRAWFHALSNIYVRTLYDGGIVTDRYILTNYAFNGTDAIEDVFDLLIKKLGMPDLTVILYATENFMYKHIAANAAGESDESIKDKVKWWQYKYEKMIYLCEKHGARYMVINMDGISPDEAVEKIVRRFGS